jgi:NAD-dependent deacetylase
LATPQAFQHNPQLVWEWYAWRRQLVSQVDPNPAHRALAALEQHVPRLTLITQNVDSLHQRAGSTGVIELHGNLARTKRFDDNVIVEHWEDTGDVPPRCPQTGSMLRPDVVWFGEMLPSDALEAATDATRNCDLFLSVGTSGHVEPAASLPYWALQNGATVAVINLDVTTRLEDPDLYKIRGPAGQILPALLRETWPDSSV